MPGGRRRKEKPPRSAGSPSFRNRRASFERGSTSANSAAPIIYQRQEIGVDQFHPRSLFASSSPRTGPDAGIGIAGAAGDPAAHRAPGGLARLAIDLS